MRSGRARHGTLARLAPLLLALAAACVQEDGSRFNPIRDFTSTSFDDEREIGAEFDREIREHVVVIDDPVVVGFLNDLGQEMVRTIEPQPFIYRFRVVDDPSLNAFAVPGGYVYFHSGTLLAAGSIDELAGVMGHEIGHVKGRHFARMKKKSQIPELLAGVAGMGAAVATGEPGLMVAAQAANVAMKLKYSREFENEADQLGVVFVTRTGHDPKGITRFFERILAEQERVPDTIPPYLFSHPDVEDRIGAVEIAADSLQPVREPDRRYEEELRAIQARLARIVASGRTSLPSEAPPPDRSLSDPLLAEAERQVEAGALDEALLLLARAEAVEPNDPRVPFRVGEILFEAGRYEPAARAYRRTVRLDPSRALLFYKLGLAHKESGDRHQAVFALEQAARRAGESSVLRRRSEWEVVKLTYAILLESGLADGTAGGESAFGLAREGFTVDDRTFAWWGRLSPRFSHFAGAMSARWIDPSGAIVQERPLSLGRGKTLGDLLRLDAPPAPGQWRVEVLVKSDLLERRSFRVRVSEETVQESR